MPAPPQICQICLRTDKRLVAVGKTLSEYHDQLSDYSLDTIYLQCCVECEHLLRKNYNFKRRCLIAARILQKWMNSRSNVKKPLDILHTLIPPSTMGIWIEDQNKIYSVSHEEVLEQSEKNGDTTPNNIIKIEKDIDSDSEIPLQNLRNLKSEKATNSFHEVLIINEGSLNNIEKTEETEFQISKTESDDENDRDSVLEVPDDTNLESDDDYESDKEIEEGRRNRSLTELSNVTLSSDDEKFEDNFKVICVKEKKVKTQLEKMNEDLDEMYKGWENTSIALPTALANDNSHDSKEILKITKRKVDKEDLKAQRSLRRKGTLAQLASISADLNTIHESCVKIINYEEGLRDPKERLKAELTNKFAQCGELKTETGFVINKETIMKCFDRVSECLMRRLWRFIHGKESLEPTAIRLLKHIQNKYQNEYEYESVFDIEYLTTNEQVLEEMHQKRQTYESYINAKYKCEKCYLGFKFEGHLEHHMNSHKESAGNFACPICGVRHKTKKSLDSHSKSHEAVYKCKICPLVTYYRGSMKNHYHQHQGMQYKCEVCEANFKSKSACMTHLGRYHRVRVCSTCGDSMTDAELRLHKCEESMGETTNADGSTNFSCKQCQTNYPTRKAYLEHVRATHLKAKRLTVMRKPKKEGPKRRPIFTCRVCEAVGTSIGWLNVHFSSEHPSADMDVLYADKHKHLCHFCGKGFSNIYNMRDHLNRHTGARPFPCPVCKKQFHRSFALNQHRLTHLPPSKACSYCGKKFRSQSNLNNHMKGHIGNRCYKCSLCDKGFLHRNALNEHVRGVHHKLRRVRKRGPNETGTKFRAASTDEGSD